MLEEYNSKVDKEIQKKWKDGISEKARAKNKGKKPYFFCDGPPYASGSIHMGTALNKVLKDVVLRSKRMQGYDVLDRPGYDTHGLPIENKVQKEKGLKTKEDIEKYGVGKFVEDCKEYATRYIGEMNNEFEKLGVWMDWGNEYKTLDNDYIDAIWWVFKKAFDKKLLYKGLYPVHACPSCETVVSYNEIEYVKQTDTAIYVKFPAKDGRFLVIWTTTPWTLPGNTGVMVNPEYEYADIEMSNGEIWVVAKERVQNLMEAIEAGFKIAKNYKGKELEGLEYENPLGKHLRIDVKNGYRVILNSRYVNLEDGTGLVHTAPGHGKEDYDASRNENLDVLSPVEINGKMKEEAGDYAGGKAREIDKKIIEDLENEGYLIYKHKYTHDYPVCWRCKSPLLMLSTEQFFFKVSEIREKLLKDNEETKWVPEWGKDRMKDWLSNLSDWPISRARYWGTPLPIWECEKCKEIKVVESKEELEKEAGKEIEMHKPKIDDVYLKCKCKGKMKRTPDVLDVWFDSGVASWASLGFPKDKEKFQRYWPADLNLEGTDQFRGWWNSEMILSEIGFGKKPFKAISLHGMVLDLGKKKLSKSAGNFVPPLDIAEEKSTDYFRYFLVKNSRGLNFSYDEKQFKEIHRFFNVFYNCASYLDMYLNVKEDFKSLKIEKAEDKWILSRLQGLIETAEKSYNEYEAYKFLGELENFVLLDLSRTYIKMIRGRTKEEKEHLSKLLSYVVLDLLKMFAPIAPFFSEHMYKQIFKGESIHLLEMSKIREELKDREGEKKFDNALLLIQNALALRDKIKIRTRWVLPVLEIKGIDLRGMEEMLKAMVNVEEVKFVGEIGKGMEVFKTEDYEIGLPLDVRDEYLDKWVSAEVRRAVQEKRKEKKLMPEDKVELKINCSDKEFLKKFGKDIEEGTNTKLKIVEEEETEDILGKLFYLEI